MLDYIATLHYYQYSKTRLKTLRRFKKQLNIVKRI